MSGFQVKRSKFAWTGIMAAVFVLSGSPSVFYAQANIKAKAQAMAAEKLTNGVMSGLAEPIKKMVASAPVSDADKAEIERKLMEAARPIVKNLIDEAMGGRLPNVKALTNTVVNELATIARNSIVEITGDTNFVVAFDAEQAADDHAAQSGRGNRSNRSKNNTASTAGQTESESRFNRTPNNNVPIASFIDTRDNRTYKTVVIGGREWMVENLNFATADGSWCYADNTSNCDTYGRLYNWSTATRACPAGWRLPSDILFEVVGDRNNRGMFDFSALSGGTRRADGSFWGGGSIGYWWTDTEISANSAYSRHVWSGFADLNYSSFNKGRAFSVRCVRD